MNDEEILLANERAKRTIAVLKSTDAAATALIDAGCSKPLDDDGIAQAAEALVGRLAELMRLLGLELHEILPHEMCGKCGRRCLDFVRHAGNRVECIVCVTEHTERGLPASLRASLTRETTFARAAEATLGRDELYGDPSENFARVASMWSVILMRTCEAHEVALCLSALKIVRAATDPRHGDNWIDLAGYAGCGAEVAQARRSAL